MNLQCVRRAVDRISSHYEFPGKDRILRRCREELDDRYRAGALERTEWIDLITRLSGSEPGSGHLETAQ